MVWVCARVHVLVEARGQRQLEFLTKPGVLQFGWNWIASNPPGIILSQPLESWVYVRVPSPLLLLPVQLYSLWITHLTLGL